MGDSLRMNKAQPHVLNNLGNCYKRQGKFSLAIRRFKSALQLQADYVDAYRNLASTLQQAGQFDESEVVTIKGLLVNPKDAGLLNLQGLARNELKDYQGAIKCFEQALQINPEHLVARHNLGLALRLNNQPQLALDCFEAVRQKQFGGFELLQNIGNAHSDLGQLESAIGFYEQVIAIVPEYAPAYHNLSRLLWSMGRQEGFLDCYENAFAKGIEAEALHLAYVEALLTAARPELALEFLAQGSLDRNSPRMCDFIARCHLEAGRIPEALLSHERACLEANTPNPFWIDFAITLLISGNVARAGKILERVYESEPDNQMALAYLTTCWRLQQDPREKLINNYDLVRGYEIPVPEGFTDLIEFNRYLDDFLTSLHTSRHHPLEQTLENGTQTQGNLFGRDARPLQLLEASFRSVISQYITEIGELPSPYPGYNQPRQFDFSASWSVRLSRSGFHKMHIHPMGWISSAYYVDLPRSMAGNDGHEGWIKFGEPNIKLADALPPQLFVEPKVGLLVLFPSYMWHGTVPFSSDERRTTVVFDAVPR